MGRRHADKPGRQAYIKSAAKEQVYCNAVAWLRGNLSSAGLPRYSAALKLFAGLSYDTLRRRYLRLTRSHTVAHEKQMLLTPVQESTLCEWMRKEALEGQPWTRLKLKVRVRELLGGEKFPSDDWLLAFERRHSSQLHLRGTSGLDPLRARCFNPQNVQDHFSQFKKIHENYRVFLNFDETGRQKGGGRKRTGKKYYTPANDRAKYKTRDASLELITIIECCSSDGTMLDPGFIFAGTGTYTAEWFEGQEHRRISVGLTENGWTNNEQCLQWFEHVLVPQARAKTLTEDEHVLLIFDGHISHLTDELLSLGEKFKIDFYLLPSHTTHKLQPLDVGCFGPLQKNWLAQCEQIVEEIGQGVDRGRFIKEYLAVRDTSIGPDVVRGAWKKTGLVPFNADIFTDADFAPSRPWSTLAHLPPSFPIASGSFAEPTSMLSTAEADTASVLSETDHPVTEDSEDAQAQMDISNSELNHDCSIRHSPSPMDVDDPFDVPHISEAQPDDTDQIHTALSRFLPLPGPHFPEFRRTTISSDASVNDRLSTLTSDLVRLEELYNMEFKRRLTAESHCAHAAKAITALKGRLAEKTRSNANKAKQFKSKAKFLMGPEAIAEREQQRKEKAAKAQEEQQKRDRQTEKERGERQQYSQMVSDPTVQFSGSLRSKRKNVLRAIACLLALSTDGTNEELCSAIHAHLLENPNFQSDPRFSKLYPSLPRPVAPEPPNAGAAVPHENEVQSDEFNHSSQNFAAAAVHRPSEPDLLTSTCPRDTPPITGLAPMASERHTDGLLRPPSLTSAHGAPAWHASPSSFNPLPYSTPLHRLPLHASPALTAHVLNGFDQIAGPSRTPMDFPQHY